MGLKLRKAAKVVLIDGDDEVLLFRGGDPARPDEGTWWFAPGGGLEGDESFEAAARREIWEETGLRLGELGPIVLRQDVEFRFLDKLVRADEAYFVVRVDRFEPSTDGWTQLEPFTRTACWSWYETRSCAFEIRCVDTV